MRINDNEMKFEITERILLKALNLLDVHRKHCDIPGYVHRPICYDEYKENVQCAYYQGMLDMLERLLNDIHLETRSEEDFTSIVLYWNDFIGLHVADTIDESKCED